MGPWFLLPDGCFGPLHHPPQHSSPWDRVRGQRRELHHPEVEDVEALTRLVEANRGDSLEALDQPTGPGLPFVLDEPGDLAGRPVDLEHAGRGRGEVPAGEGLAVAEGPDEQCVLSPEGRRPYGGLGRRLMGGQADEGRLDQRRVLDQRVAVLAAVGGELRVAQGRRSGEVWPAVPGPRLDFLDPVGAVFDRPAAAVVVTEVGRVERPVGGKGRP